MTPRTALALALLVGCGNDVGLPPATKLDDSDAFGVTGLRRLDRFEVTASLSDVFGVATDDVEALLPEDISGTNPFANSYRSQTVSPLVTSSYAGFAQAYAAKLAASLDVQSAERGGSPPRLPTPWRTSGPRGPYSRFVIPPFAFLSR